MKKVIKDNLLSDLATNISLLEPLSNLLDESSGVITEATTNSLPFTCKAGGKAFGAIVGFNTNADSVEIFVSLEETNRLANADFSDGNTGWNVGDGCTINNGAANFDGSQAATTSLGQTSNQQTKSFLADENYRLEFRANITAGNLLNVYVGNHLFDPAFDDLDGSGNGYRYEGKIVSNSDILIEVSDDFIGTIDSLSLKRILLLDDNLSDANKWDFVGPWSIGSGASIDGSQTGTAYIGQTSLLIDPNKIYKVHFEVTSYVAGAITQIQLGIVHTTVNITANGSYTYYIKPSIDDAHHVFYLYVDADFHGIITTIEVTEAGHYQKTFTNRSSRERNFFYELDADSSAQPGSAADITATFTSPTGSHCYLGILSVGEITELDCPEYGLQLEMVNNEVSIPYTDASRYRRFRSPQKVYSGQLAAKTSTETINKIREILRTTGSKPMAWVLAPARAADTLLWGGVFDNTQEFAYLTLDYFNFTIAEEL